MKLKQKHRHPYYWAAFALVGKISDFCENLTQTIFLTLCRTLMLRSRLIRRLLKGEYGPGSRVPLY